MLFFDPRRKFFRTSFAVITALGPCLYEIRVKKGLGERKIELLKSRGKVMVYEVGSKFRELSGLEIEKMHQTILDSSEYREFEKRFISPSGMKILHEVTVPKS
ncbi:MAG: hypothetical protein U1C12_01605 [Patescibacteria group bacterium]|nr:hypothetical protein [Patescibacteria group bacterium]